MDEQTYMTKMSTAFLEELSEIEKQAFLGKAWKFLRAGGRNISQGVSRLRAPGGGATLALGGRGAVRAGGVMPHMQQIWRAGAAKAGKAGGGEFMGGLGALARSRYGQMAAVPLAVGGGIYATRKVLGTGQQQRY